MMSAFRVPVLTGQQRNLLKKKHHENIKIIMFSDSLEFTGTDK